VGTLLLILLIYYSLFNVKRHLLTLVFMGLIAYPLHSWFQTITLTITVTHHTWVCKTTCSKPLEELPASTKYIQNMVIKMTVWVGCCSKDLNKASILSHWHLHQTSKSWILIPRLLSCSPNQTLPY